MVAIMRKSSDSLLDIIRNLREQTGINPIPLTAVEKRSGVVEAFAAAVTSAQPRPYYQLNMAQNILQEEVALAQEEFAQEKAAQEKAAQEKAAQEKAAQGNAAQAKTLHRKVLENPELLPPGLQTTIPKTSKRAAMCLAAYKRNL